MIIKYRAGRVHRNADPLSRAPLSTFNITATCNTVSAATVESDFLNFVKSGYEEDKHFFSILLTAQVSNNHRLSRFRLMDGILLHVQPGDDYTRVCIPNNTKLYNLRAQISHDHHDAGLCGHLGTTKTLNAWRGSSNGRT